MSWPLRIVGSFPCRKVFNGVGRDGVESAEVQAERGVRVDGEWSRVGWEVDAGGDKGARAWTEEPDSPLLLQELGPLSCSDAPSPRVLSGCLMA